MSDAVTAYVRPDDSTAVALLKEQVAGLTHRLEAVTSERDQYRDAYAQLDEEHTELQAASVTPDAKDSRIKELEATIRTGKHRDTFAQLAKKAGIKDEALADLFDLIKAKPGEFGADGKLFDADDADAKAYEAILAKARETRGYAFNPAEEGQGGDGNVTQPRWPDGRFQANATPPVVGSGRGEQHGGRGLGFIPKDQIAARLSDPAFALDPANRDVIMASFQN